MGNWIFSANKNLALIMVFDGFTKRVFETQTQLGPVPIIKTAEDNFRRYLQ